MASKATRLCLISCMSALATLSMVVNANTVLPDEKSKTMDNETSLRILDILPPIKVCYKYVGCFGNEPPFHTSQRPVVNLPFDPTYLDTKFLLHTRVTFNGTGNSSDRLAGEELVTGSEDSLEKSNFDEDRETKIIVHGFVQTGEANWIRQMTVELLKYDDFNVIAVDWRKGASWPYTQAVSNARLVGVQLANLIDFLMRRRSARADGFHLIGHSLGAHVAGYAGQRLKNLKRISGLDPAGVFFKLVDRDVRLDSTDADFVDVVHTDAGPIGFGLVDRLGHLDFYPNRGLDQPGCVDNEQALHDKLFEESPVASKEERAVLASWRSWPLGPLDRLGCSHHRAIEYYIESINGHCQFFGYECASWWRFQSGQCWPCRLNETCVPMGFHATLPRTGPVRRTLLLSTASVEGGPFCVNCYRVQLKVSGRQRKYARGHVLVLLNGHANESAIPQKELTHIRPFKVGPETLSAGRMLAHLFDGRRPINPSALVVKYIRDVSFLEEWKYDSGLRLASATVETINNKGRLVLYRMCTNDDAGDKSPVIHSGRSRIFGRTSANCTNFP